MSIQMSKLMNKYRHAGLSTGLLIILLVVSAGQVSADPAVRQVSYSPDYWPTRWSSAIRQQQTARFPTRVEEKVTLEELPETVLEQDLFYSPSLNARFDQGDRPYSYGQRELKHHFSRNSGRHNRDAAFAYQSRYGAAPANYARSPYGSAYPAYGAHPYPFASPMPAVGLLPGYPGAGFPMMPGVPGAYPMNLVPFGVMPFGYPGNMAMWNPPFGPW
jgi:hypothetical protein